MPTAKLKEHSEFIILFSLCFIYFLHDAGKGFWHDELSVLADLLDSGSLSEMLAQLKFEVHAPGLYVIVFVMNKLSLTSPVALRVPSIIAASLGVVGFAKIARHYMNTLWTFSFGLFCASLPGLQWHATEMRPHIFLFSFCAWILFYLHKAMLNSDNETFISDVEKAVCLFALSLFFHFGTIFVIFVFFVPFLILYRKEIAASKRRFSNITLFGVYPATAGLLALASYLFRENFSSILWGTSQPPLRTVYLYLTQSFGFAFPSPHFITFLAYLAILAALLKRRVDTNLRHIFAFYILSVLIIYISVLMKIPLERSRYTLYLIPIPVLMTYASLYSLRLKKILRVAFLISAAYLSYINLQNPVYKMDLAPKNILAKAAELLRQKPESRLVIIGECRTLTYYLNEFHLSENQNLMCFNPNTKAELDVLSHNIKELAAINSRIYVLTYGERETLSTLKNLNGHVIHQEDTWAALLELGKTP